jgi:hypothetical protein
VTITFHGNLFKISAGPVECPVLVIVAWCALLVTILSSLVGILAESDALGEAVKKIAALEAEPTGPRWIFRNSPYFMWTSFIIAIVAFVVFASLNAF